jgi:hypothetical protein
MSDQYPPQLPSGIQNLSELHAAIQKEIKEQPIRREAERARQEAALRTEFDEWVGRLEPLLDSEIHQTVVYANAANGDKMEPNTVVKRAADFVLAKRAGK